MGRTDCGRIAGWAAGLLAVLAMAEVGGFFPASVTGRDRVTFLVYQLSPLTGSWLLDAAAAGVLGAILLACSGYTRPGGALGYLASALAAGLLLVAAPGWAGVAVVTLLAAAPLLAAHRGIRPRFALEAAGLAIALLEAAAATAVLLYFAEPGYAWLVDAVTLRERRLWSLPAAAWPLLAPVAGAAWLACIAARLRSPGARCPLDRLQAPRGRGGRLLLAAGLLLALLLVALPHLPTVNPRLQPVSVDTFYYSRFLEAADRYGLSYALAATHGLARSAYMVALYLVHRLTRLDPYTLMDIVHPLAAFTLIVLSAARLAEKRLGCCSGEAALLAAAGWLPTFLLSGLHANSLAAAVALQYFALGSAGLAAAMLVAALIHPWTHLVYSAGLAADRLWRRDLRGAAAAALLAAAAFAASDAVNRVLAGYAAAAAVTGSLQGGLGREPVRGAVYGALLWSWGSLDAAPWVQAAGAVAPLYTPAAVVEAVAAPPALAANRVIAHRLFLEIPFWLPAAAAAALLPRRLRLGLLAAAAAGALLAAYYAAPLHGPLWEGIWQRILNPAAAGRP
jgi:hypothetical protein